MIWKISKSSHFKLLIKCFQAIVIKLLGEKFFKVALLSYKKMALLALFKTDHTGPSSTGSLGLHQISADIGSPVCSLPKSWDINKRNLFPQITLREYNSQTNKKIQMKGRVISRVGSAVSAHAHGHVFLSSIERLVTVVFIFVVIWHLRPPRDTSC